MKTLTKTNAHAAIACIRAGDFYDFERNVTDDGVDCGITDREIEAAKNAFTQLKARFPNPQSPNVGARFEAEGAETLHRLWQLTPTAVGNAHFWIWLSVRHFADLIEWRHGADGRSADLANYGLETRWNGLLLRMWMRGDIGYREGDDPYRLAKRGDQDFWRSHIFRQNFASCRSFAQAFIVEVYETEDPERAALKTEHIRELAKRLRRLYATTPYEVLSYEASRQLLRAEITQVLAAG